MSSVIGGTWYYILEVKRSKCKVSRSIDAVGLRCRWHRQKRSLSCV